MVPGRRCGEGMLIWAPSDVKKHKPHNRSEEAACATGSLRYNRRQFNKLDLERTLMGPVADKSRFLCLTFCLAVALSLGGCFVGTLFGGDLPVNRLRSIE